MPAYIHAEVEVHDLVDCEDYRRQVAGVLAQFGGRFIVCGGAGSFRSRLRLAEHRKIDF